MAFTACCHSLVASRAAGLYASTSATAYVVPVAGVPRPVRVRVQVAARPVVTKNLS